MLNWQMHRLAIEIREPDSTLTVHRKILSILLKILKTLNFLIILFISAVIQQIFLFKR
jgi:hypothetical protein